MMTGAIINLSRITAGSAYHHPLRSTSPLGPCVLDRGMRQRQRASTAGSPRRTTCPPYLILFTLPSEPLTVPQRTDHLTDSYKSAEATE